MHETSDKNECSDSKRIKELGEKATQLLLFLSFALLAAVTLKTSEHSGLGPCQTVALKYAIRFWVAALFPILVSVLPLKEIISNLKFIRYFKVALLWVAIIPLITVGAASFLCAVW